MKEKIKFRIWVAWLTQAEVGPIIYGMKNVLIVEDDDDIRDCLLLRIEAPTINVLTACNGVDAWDKINALKIDLVITDYRMPKMDGAKLTILIKQSFPEIPIIWISTFDVQELELQDSVHSVLQKPFDTDILKNKIEEILLLKSE